MSIGNRVGSIVCICSPILFDGMRVSYSQDCSWTGSTSNGKEEAMAPIPSSASQAYTEPGELIKFHAFVRHRYPRVKQFRPNICAIRTKHLRARILSTSLPEGVSLKDQAIADVCLRVQRDTAQVAGKLLATSCDQPSRNWESGVTCGNPGSIPPTLLSTPNGERMFCGWDGLGLAHVTPLSQF
eukprot:3554837-Amphidinium_carterae.1